MNRTDTETELRRVRDARQRWSDGHVDFTINVNAIMRRLIHEAIANRMSAEQIADLSGITVKRVREVMRNYGLNPKGGVQALSRMAAEALANNAELLGIEPREMDLMSPLAYLPAGSELRKAMAAERVSKVTEVDEVSGNEDSQVIKRVLAIHYPVGGSDTYDPYCHGCWEAGGMDGAPSWPCETAIAVGVEA